jgi:hypothetical protein
MKIGMIHPEDKAAGSPGVSVNLYQITGVVKTSNVFTLMLKPFMYFQVTYLFLDLLKSHSFNFSFGFVEEN